MNTLLTVGGNRYLVDMILDTERDKRNWYEYQEWSECSVNEIRFMGYWDTVPDLECMKRGNCRQLDLIKSNCLK